MAKSNKQEILVVEAGWVFLGVVGASANADSLRLNDAHVIRAWGTTKGLGQIALEGPTKETVLDACGVVDIPKGKVLFRIPCIY